ncbi:MAG: hypothetical protein D4R67_00155 [Bacteroidetes bacterium]|nr:MAG: hypothetical protein D4R67_00155 [Bacteroidota bacterium]
MPEEIPIKSRKALRGEAIWSIIWNLFFLWLVNKVPDWGLPFITDRYDTVLWILNLNIIIQIIGWALILFLEFRWLWHLVRAILDASSLVVLLVLYFLYPFDFSAIGGWSWLDVVLPIIFIIGMVASGLGVIIHLFKLILRKN